MTHYRDGAWVHATACGVPVPQLLELAAMGEITLAVLQPGWLVEGVWEEMDSDALGPHRGPQKRLIPAREVWAEPEPGGDEGTEIGSALDADSDVLPSPGLVPLPVTEDQRAEHEAAREKATKRPYEQPHQLEAGFVTLLPFDAERLQVGQIGVVRVIHEGMELQLAFGPKPITWDRIRVDPDHPLVVAARARAVEHGEVAHGQMQEVLDALARVEELVGKNSLKPIMTRSEALAALRGRREPGTWATELVDSIQIPTGGRTWKVLREDLFKGLGELRDGGLQDRSSTTPLSAPSTLPVRSRRAKKR